MKRLFTPELVVLTILSAITRYWHLSTPNAVIFDETYYKSYAGHYLARGYFFDLHPPLGKLLFAAAAHVFGVPASTLLGPDPVVILRVLPAFFGTLMVPLAYIILRQLDGSRRVASLGAFAVLCENALIVDSRLTLMEPLLIGFGLAAIALYLAAGRATGWSRYAWLATSALMAGCALSVKWTGASALGLILAAWFFEAVRRRFTWKTLGEGALLVAIPVAVYIGAFAIHFALLRRAGVGQAAAPARVRATLIGEPTYDPTLHVSLFEKMADAHRQMNHANVLLSVPHPAASPWYTWPVMKHPIGLWQNTHPRSGWRRSVILIGNPVIWWGGLVVVIVSIIAFSQRRELIRSHRFPLAFLGGAFLINFVPFIGIRRTMFIYHYLFALVCLILLASYCVGILAGWTVQDETQTAADRRRSTWTYRTVLAVIFVGFAFFAPLTYGWSLSHAGYDARFWVLEPRL